MSEEETIDAVVIEREPTLKQARLAERLKDPDVDTYTKALVGSGYSETTAAKSAKVIRESVGVQRAMRQIEAEQRGNRDKAREVVSRSLHKASENIDGETDPLRLMDIAARGAVVLEKTPDEGNDAEDPTKTNAEARTRQEIAWHALDLAVHVARLGARFGERAVAALRARRDEIPVRAGLQLDLADLNDLDTSQRHAVLNRVLTAILSASYRSSRDRGFALPPAADNRPWQFRAKG